MFGGVGGGLGGAAERSVAGLDKKSIFLLSLCGRRTDDRLGWGGGGVVGGGEAAAQTTFPRKCLWRMPPPARPEKDAIAGYYILCMRYY